MSAIKRFSFALCACIFATGATAATLSDTALRSDLTSTTYSFDLGDIDETASSSLTFLAGVWNGSLMSLNLSINGAFFGSFSRASAFYLSDSESISISGLLADDTNTFVFARASGTSTFAISDVSVTYAEAPAAPIPLPAALPLLAAGLGMFAWMRRKST